jgi:hypothetical protein
MGFVVPFSQAAVNEHMWIHRVSNNAKKFGMT